MTFPFYLPVLLAQAGDAAARVGQGRIVGGWGYVWVSYAIAWGGMLLYALSLWLRHRRQQAASKESP